MLGEQLIDCQAIRSDLGGDYTEKKRHKHCKKRIDCITMQRTH